MTMNKSNKIISLIVGLLILLPGLAKFIKPFDTFIFEQLYLTGIPFPEIMQYMVKFSEVTVGLTLIYLAVKGSKISPNIRSIAFYLTHLTIIGMMLVATYVHLHPNVPAEILPMEVKPPFMPIFYLLIVFVNIFLFKRIKLFSKN